MKKHTFIVIRSIITICVIIIGTTAVNARLPMHQYPVISYNLWDVAGINAEIQAANSNTASVPWIMDTFQIANRLLIGNTTGLQIWIEKTLNSVESPTKSTITLIKRGFLDDSIDGDWSQYIFEREDRDKAWVLTESRRAVTCARLTSKPEFTKEICP